MPGDRVIVPVLAGDERPHRRTADPVFSESYFINFHDAGGVLGGFSRIALPQAGKDADGLLGVYLPGGDVGYLRGDATVAFSDGPAVGRSHTQACVEPLERWRVSYEGPLAVFADPKRVPEAVRANAAPDRTCDARLEIEAIGIHPPILFPPYLQVRQGPPHAGGAPMSLSRKLKRAWRRPGEILSALNMRSGKHYEQAIRFHGSLTVDGARFELAGAGQRDHSWGPRDWAPSERWRWLSGQFGDFAFTAFYLTIAGTHVINGYVYRNGTCTLIDELSLHTTFDDTGLAGRTIDLQLSCGGDRYDISGEVLTNVPLPINAPRSSAMYTVGRARYRHAGAIGYGAAEFLERLDP